MCLVVAQGQKKCGTLWDFDTLTMVHQPNVQTITLHEVPRITLILNNPWRLIRYSKKKKEAQPVL